MTRPLVDAEAGARVGQAPRFVSAVALADATSRASIWVGCLGWLLGVAILVSSEAFDRSGVTLIVGVQITLFVVLTAFATAMARRGAAADAEPLPAGVVLVPPSETRRVMQRAWMAGMLIAIVLLAAMTAGSNQSLLGGWSAAMIALGFGQRARGRAFAEREVQLDKSLWVPERRQRDVPRLVAGPRSPEFTDA
ncbi:MAG: hypothetical protein PGN13_14285 [Patulibacter minatonensis]